MLFNFVLSIVHSTCEIITKKYSKILRALPIDLLFQFVASNIVYLLLENTIIYRYFHPSETGKCVDIIPIKLI